MDDHSCLNNQQPTTNNQQPTTNNLWTNNQQPTTNNQQPTTNNQQPTTTTRGLPEQVIEVPRVTLQGRGRAPRRSSRVAAGGEGGGSARARGCPSLARGTSALGLDWCHVAAQGRGFWWQTGTRHVRSDPPPGFTASPGRYINTGQRLRRCSRGRLCDHAAQIPAVHRRVLQGASASVHRQSGGIFWLRQRDRNTVLTNCAEVR